MTDTDIEIRIKAESAKASKDIANLNKQIDKMNKTIAKGGAVTKQNVGQMTRSFKSLTAHVSKLAIIYGTFKTLLTGTVITAKFEESIKKLGVYSGATGEDLTALEDKAKSLGKSTVFSASQVADGMNEMALAGLSSADMLAGIGDTLNLASVGMISLKEATDFTVTAMKTYGLEAKDMNDITDIFAKGSTISATTVTQLGQALKKVGAVAYDYNVSLEETTALLGVLADGGRRGAEAGTQLKISMLRLASNPEAKKYLDALGISMYEMVKQADGTNKQVLLPFTEQLRIVRDRLKELDAEAKNEAMARIFGTEAVASASMLMQNLEGVHEKLGKIRDAMQNDFATSSAKAIVDTLIGSFKNLLSALEGLAIKIVGEMTPALREMLDQWTETIRAMDDDSIQDVADSLTTIIKTMGVLTSVLTTVIGGLMSWSTSNKNLAKTLGTMGIALLLIRKYALMTDKSLLLLARNPYFLILAGAIVTYDLIIDRMERQNKVAEKNADIIVKQAKASTDFTSELEAMYKTLEDGTVVLGENNAERGIFAVSVGKAIQKLREADDALDKNQMGEEAYNAQKKKNAIQMALYIETLKAIGKAYTVETEAIAKETEALIKNASISKEALENYEKFDKALQKRVDSTQKAVTKIEKLERGLLIKQAQIEKERASIISKYADARLQVLEDYEKIEYEGRLAGLSDYQKYTQDMLRADALLKKGREALNDGRIDEAERFYSEAKSLTSSFAGTVIEQDGKILASAKETYSQASKRYIETKKGELAILEQKKIAELSANKQKLDLVILELEAQRALLNMQKETLEHLRSLGDVAKETKEKFDKPDYLEKINKDFDDTIKKLKEKSLTMKADIEDTKFKAKMAQIKGDTDTLNGKTIKPKIDTEGIDIATEKTYHIEKQLQTIDGEEVEVWIRVESKDLDETKDKLNGIITLSNKPNTLQIKTDDDEVEATLNTLVIIDEKTKQPIVTRVIAHDEELGQLVSKLRNLSNEDFMAEIRAEYGQLDEAVVKVKDLQKVANKDIIVDVDIKTNNAKDEVKDFVEETKTESPETQPLETKTDIAKSEITNFIIWVNTQKPNLELSVESSQAQQAVNNFVQWASSKTIRIPIVTYQANASGGLIAPIQRLASGGTFTGSGRVAGYDATDSDKVTAMLTGGEYVIKREAVDNIGLDVLHNINNMTVKGYSQGGQVSSGGESGVQPINLNIGGNSFKMTSDRETAEALQRFLESEGGL